MSSPTLSRIPLTEGLSGRVYSLSEISNADSTENFNPAAVNTSQSDERTYMERGPLWRLDLQLLHYYMTHVSSMIADEQDIHLTMLWQHDLPRLAFQCDYLMHALLCFSASHMVKVGQNQAAPVQSVAMAHLDQAKLLYRLQGMGPATAGNADTNLIFIWLLTLSTYAMPREASPLDAAVEVLQLLQEVNVFVAETWSWISQHQHETLLGRGFQLPTIILPEHLSHGMCSGVQELNFMLDSEPMAPLDKEICVLVLNELKQLVSEVGCGQGVCNASLILYFPRQDPAVFANLLRQRVPQALVIMAFYCVLLHLLSACWWMGDWPRRLMQDILRQLEHPWKHWLRWSAPCVGVIFQEEALPAP